MLNDIIRKFKNINLSFEKFVVIFFIGIIGIISFFLQNQMSFMSYTLHHISARSPILLILIDISNSLDNTVAVSRLQPFSVSLRKPEDSTLSSPTAP